MPFLGEACDFCRVTRWLVHPGDMVEIDQDLAEITAGHEMLAFPSPVDGRIVEICIAPGAVAVTDETILVIEQTDCPREGVD